MASVMRISEMVISVEDTFLIPASSCAVSEGRNGSQDTNSAPVALILFSNALKE